MKLLSVFIYYLPIICLLLPIIYPSIYQSIHHLSSVYLSSSSHFTDENTEAQGSLRHLPEVAQVSKPGLQLSLTCHLEVTITVPSPPRPPPPQTPTPTLFTPFAFEDKPVAFVIKGAQSNGGWGLGGSWRLKCGWPLAPLVGGPGAEGLGAEGIKVSNCSSAP